MSSIWNQEKIMVEASGDARNSKMVCDRDGSVVRDYDLRVDCVLD